MTHPNEDVIRRLYDARARGDEASIRELIHPDVRWIDPYPPPFGGEFHGIDALFDGLFAALENDLEDSGLELHDVVANDEHTLALVNWWAVRGGRRMDGREVGIYHVRDGKVTEAWFFTEDKAASDRFFS